MTAAANMTQLLSMAEQASAQHGLPAGLLEGLIDTESGWNPGATGKNTGSVDRGLLQINSRWQPQVSNAQAYNPAFAINWGASYLAGLLKKSGGNVTAALEEYNSGRPNGAPGYAATVLKAATRYGYHDTGAALALNALTRQPAGGGGAATTLPLTKSNPVAVTIVAAILLAIVLEVL